MLAPLDTVGPEEVYRDRATVLTAPRAWLLRRGSRM